MLFTYKIGQRGAVLTEETAEELRGRARYVIFTPSKRGGEWRSRGLRQLFGRKKEFYLTWCARHRRYEELLAGSGSDGTLFLPGEGACTPQGEAMVMEELPGEGEELYDFLPEAASLWERFRSWGLSAWQRLMGLDCGGFYNLETLGILPYVCEVELKEGPEDISLRLDALVVELGRIRERRGAVCGVRRMQLSRAAYRVVCNMRAGTLKETAEGGHASMASWRSAVPPEARRQVMKLAQESAARIYGFAPPVREDYAGALEYFVCRPLDMLAPRLRPFCKGQFDTIVPPNEVHSFEALCAFFGLKPCKSLHRAYLAEPLALPVVQALREAGFKDINHLIRLVSPQGVKFFFRYDLREWPLHEGISVKEWLIPNEEEKLFLRRSALDFVKLLLQEKSEAAVCRFILREQRREESHWMPEDTMTMAREYWERLPESVRKKLLRDGLTQAVHNELSREVTKLRFPAQELNYAEDKLSAEVDGYCFSLVHNTGELTEIGSRLHNCVVSYTRRVISGQVKIVSVKQADEYVACLEVREREVVQAKADHNRCPEGALREAVFHWLAQVGLRNNTSDLRRAP